MVALHKSVVGTSRHFATAPNLSPFRGIADIDKAEPNSPRFLSMPILTSRLPSAQMVVVALPSLPSSPSRAPARPHCRTRRFAGPACPQRRRSNAFSKLRHRRAGVSDPRTRSSAVSAMAGRRIAILLPSVVNQYCPETLDLLR
jgi:hypothetical protein